MNKLKCWINSYKKKEKRVKKYLEISRKIEKNRERSEKKKKEDIDNIRQV